MKLILDRSIFHNQLFIKVFQKLKELKAKGHINICVSPMLLEETFALMFNEKRRRELIDSLQFILEISNERWLGDNFIIFRSELGVMPPRKEYNFLKAKQERILKGNIKAVIDGGRLTPNAFGLAKNDKNIIYRKAQNMRKIGYKMQLEVSRVLEKLGKKRSDVTETWESFRDENLEKFGEDLIRTKRFHTRFFKWIAIKRWRKKKDYCPYFTDWVAGLLYIQYYAMRYPNEPIDKNAQADIQHLLYLRDSDAIVSEDQRFMKKAWADLYQSKGKLYLTINDLLNDRIANPSPI